jgi:hypothetical protein
MSFFSRSRRIEQLAALGDVTGLAELLVDSARHAIGTDQELAATAAALVDLGAPGIGALVEVVLTDPDQRVFSRMPNEVFHRAAGPHAVNLLTRALLHDPAAGVRLAAATMLHRLDTALADEAFAVATADLDPRVRLAAARGLADHGDSRGVHALLEWVAHSDDPAPALAALVRLGDRADVDVLEQLRLAGRPPAVVSAIDQAIAELRAARPSAPEPADRLERLRDRLRSIELVHRRPAPRGVDAERAGRKLSAVCTNLSSAAAALRSGSTPLGRPLSRLQVGIGLAALVADVGSAEFARQIGLLLEPRGARAVQEVMADVDLMAAQLAERGPYRPRTE